MGSKNKKLIIIFVLLICIPILLLVFLAVLRGCSNSYSYEEYEKKMISASQKYAKNRKKLPKNNGDSVVINLSDLEDKDYIKKATDVIKNDSCTGTVTIKNNGGQYLYIPDLVCENHKTQHLIDTLLKDVVDSKDGLYKVNDGYVYKGAKVNNYVSINKKIYRIMSIDENNILKLVYLKQDDKMYVWDRKYNVEKKQSVGKNDYTDSNMLDIINEKYEKISDSEKKHFVSYNLCIGKRSKSNLAVNKDEECSVILPNQFIGLLNTYDFAMASYDIDCNSIKSGACQNYNYLHQSLGTTWLINGLADNTYDVAYYSGGYIYYNMAYYSKKVHYVFYIDGNEIINKGDGSKDNPYVINN